MRILYGIQGTGNGHISRANDVIRELSKRARVDILVSGSEHEVRPGFEVKYRAKGLGFVFGRRGGIDYWESIKRMKPAGFIMDAIRVPIKEYDLVISDFEPITAWCARARGVRSVALSHQASFMSPKTPRPKKRSLFAELVLRWYAPCTVPIGFHFESYDSFIHTPVIREEVRKVRVETRGHYTVYLPFFDETYLASFLKRIDVKWEVFSKHHRGAPYTLGNITVFPIASGEFIRSMSSSEGVLCGAGFETPAEALYLGKKLLVIPMKGQYEQSCNAEALSRMGVGVVEKIDSGFEKTLSDWVESPMSIQINYEYKLPQIVEQIIELASC
jgi:uncharacterized protein (TIGR00661 family)